jgi:predicted nucleic acid-binding protein
VILLDTNVLSEAVKLVPSPAVLRWLAAQEPLSVYTTTITQAEILYGIEALPRGKRQTRLATAAEQTFAEDFRGRILSFDEEAARRFGKIMGARSAAGRPISQLDGMIAAIALRHGASLATRNVADFEVCGIQVINPWTE